MSTVDDLDPAYQPERTPRRGDKVIAAPYCDLCLSGEVVSFAKGRLGVLTKVHGRIELPISRFTWKPRQRAWVCWPADVIRELRQIDTREAPIDIAKLHVFAEVGDCVVLETLPLRPVGWITKLIGAPLTAPRQGMLMNALSGYLISTEQGGFRYAREKVSYDTGRQQWLANGAGERER